MTSGGADSLLASIDDVRHRPDCVDSIEEELQGWIRERDWSCRVWTDPPETKHPPHDHPYGHRVLCVSGWIEFTVRDSTYRLGPGDALDLPEQVSHAARSAPDCPTEYWLIRPGY